VEMVSATVELASVTKAGRAMIAGVPKMLKLVKRRVVTRFVLELASVNVGIVSARVPSNSISLTLIVSV